MAYEEDAEQVVHFSLIPIRAIVQSTDGWNGSGFICVCLDADAGVVADGEHVVDNFEAGISRRIVDRCDVSYHCELGCGMVFEEVEGREHAGRGDVDCEFVFPDGELLDEGR